MQSKKRAKPVKFGKKESESKASTKDVKPKKVKEAEEEVDTVVIVETETEQIEEPQADRETSLETAQETDQSESETTDDEKIQKAIDQAEAESEAEEDTQVVDKDTKSVDEQETEEKSTPAFGADTYVVEKQVNRSVLGYFWLVAILSFFIGIASMVGVSFLLQQSGTSLPGLTAFSNPTPTPTAQPTKTPTPTPDPVALDEYGIQILNGSGVSGAAGQEQTALEAAGFKVDSVGNASSSDFEETVIYAEDDVNIEYLVKLKDELKKTHTVGKDLATSPAPDSDVDVIIILGSGTP